MRILRQLILSTVFLSCTPGTSGLQLKDLEGLPVDPFQNRKARATVFLFTRTDCPVSNRYAPEVRSLYNEFAPQGVVFWLIYVDPNRSAEEIRRHLREYEYACPALQDSSHTLVRRTQAQVTPEAAVFLANGELIYRGRIDDLYLDFGVRRPAPTSHDLRDILRAIVRDEPVMRRTTAAVGCFISDLR